MKENREHSRELKIVTNHRSPKRKWSCSWLWPRLTSRSRRLGYRYRRISVLSCLFTTDLMASIRRTRVLAAPCYHNSKRSRWKSRNSSTYTRDPARFWRRQRHSCVAGPVIESNDCFIETGLFSFVFLHVSYHSWTNFVGFFFWKNEEYIFWKNV